MDLLHELNREENLADVDTVILHAGTLPLTELTREAEEAAKNGSVLVTTSLPTGRSWKNLTDLTKGGAAQ